MTLAAKFVRTNMMATGCCDLALLVAEPSPLPECG
jgi:hypothetical protein